LKRTIERTEDPHRLFELRHNLADELLRAGRPREAIAELLRVRDALSAISGASDARDRTLATVREDLAIAFLRLGEQENCLARHGPDSCIFPISSGGVHAVQDGSRMAIASLSESLRERSEDLASRWLLNLAHMTVGEYPSGVPAEWLIPPQAFASDAAFPRFADVAPQRGVAALGLAGGCCVDDFDGDGDLDIVASSWGLRDPLRFFRQVAGGRFEDYTEAAGLAGEAGGLNICHADYDNDGALDVLVLRGGWLAKGEHPNSLLRNRGDGTFDDVTERAGLSTFHPTQNAAWADFDRDGWLDLFVGNEQSSAGNHRSELFRNNGDGTFTDCAAPSGLADLGFVKGSAWGDYDNDGWPDLYVSRIDQPNRLFRNCGRRRQAAGEEPAGADRRAVAWDFTDVTAQAGVSEPVHSFPTWFFDYDNDGWLDLFVGGFDGCSVADVAADYLGQPHRRGHPRLYRNRQDGTFEDVTREARLDRVLLVMGAGFGDLDNDGYPDLYLGTGAPDLRTLMPNRMFRNDGGRAFQDVTTAGGFGHVQKGHGIAFADIDGDGDQDVYAVMGGWYTGDLYHNVLFENPGFGRRWITLRLRGTRSNRAAIGARIRVDVRAAGGGRSIHAVVGTGGSFGSSSLQAEIGLGDARSLERVEVRWPSGVVQVLTGLALDHVHEVIEPNA
jgi:hypothetical protein